MKLVVAARSLSLTGGIERYTTEMVAALAQRGHDVTVVTSHVDVDPIPGVTVVLLRSLPLPGPLEVLAELGTFGPRATRAVRKLPGAPLLYRPLGFADGPGVVTAHSCHAAWLADRDRVLGASSPNLLDRALLAQERRTFATPRLVATTVSYRCAAEIEAHYGVVVPPQRIVPPAVDRGRFPVRTADERSRAREVLGIEPHAFAVGAVANYSFRRKRVTTSVEACAQIGATLLVAGTIGSDGKEAVQRADELGADVHFLGSFPDMPTFYAALDAFALPSLNEAYGMAAHEAMARGVPVVVSDRCGIVDFLEPGVHAVVLSDDVCSDPTRLGQALADIRDGDDDAVTRAGAAWAHERSWTELGDALEAVLLEAARTPR